MDLRQVRAIVTDREVLASLQLDVVAHYLREHGWSENGGHSTGKLWIRGGKGRKDVLFLPRSRDYGDFAIRMGEALTAIAEAEDRSQLAVLSDLLEAGEVRCSDCGSALPIRVCRSAAGHYIGRWCDTCGPYERISADYFATAEEAEAALASGEYDDRGYAIENQGVKG